MSKRALSFILTLLLTTSLFFVSFAAAAAEERDAENATEYQAEYDAEYEAETYGAPLTGALTDPSGSLTEPVSATVEPTYSEAEHPVLTVSAISNYFGRIDAEYNEFTRELTVSYILKSSRLLLSTDWTLTYDTSLLTADPYKNTLKTICPPMQDDSVMQIDAENGTIRYSSSNLEMFDFTRGETPFVKIIFDVVPLSPKDSEITKVDLTVNDLMVSEPNPNTGETLHEKEVVLVANGKVLSNNLTKTVRISKYTTITPSTFSEEYIRPASVDQAVTTVPPSTAASTAAPSAKASADGADAKATPDAPLLNTGSLTVSLLILAILFVCSTVLFILRKRDIYND